MAAAADPITKRFAIIEPLHDFFGHYSMTTTEQPGTLCVRSAPSAAILTHGGFWDLRRLLFFPTRKHVSKIGNRVSGRPATACQEDQDAPTHGGA
jgi:hypothetical protein